MCIRDRAYAVRIEDKIDSSDKKNSQLNAIVSKAIKIIEKNGDKISVDFPIILNDDGKWEENFTSDASKKLFMTNLFGKTLKKNNHDYSNASVGEIISYLKNDLFEVTEKCSDQMLLKILAIRYNVYALSLIHI